MNRFLGRYQVPAITSSVGVAFALATALLGAALGVLPDVVAGDPRSDDFAPRLWTGIAFLITGLAALWLGVRLWRFRGLLLERRGTAYLIQELAEAWTHEEKATFLADLQAHFPAVKNIPGPDKLTGAWDWPLGEGAEDWDRRVDEVVLSFWALQYNDEYAGRGALFVWAWWSVALAFAARATCGRRQSALRVRQRPSVGRVGRLDLDTWRQEAHTFTHRGPVAAGQEMPPRAVTLQITARGGPSRGAQRIGRWVDALLHSSAAHPMSPTVLLVRMTRTTFGKDLNAETPADADVTFLIDDAVGFGNASSGPATLLEWRCLPTDGSFHPWSDFPALARSAVDWVADQSVGVRGPVLLGLLVPQEVAVGMGILIGSRLARRRDGSWPEHVWPLHPANQRSGDLVVPRLDLGRESLSGVHQGRQP